MPKLSDVWSDDQAFTLIDCLANLLREVSTWQDARFPGEEPDFADRCLLAAYERERSRVDAVMAGESVPRTLPAGSGAP